MIRITGIGSYIPHNRESNFDKKDIFGIDDRFITEKLGVEKVSRKLPEEDTSDLCLKALNSLREKIDFSFDDVDCLVVCTQNPDGNGIPHTSAVVHGKLNISQDCAAFDISLGCSGYVYSLSLVKSFMAANGLKTGLLFTADPYSKIINAQDRGTVLLFGDAATVTLLQEFKKNNGSWLPKSFSFATRGRDGMALHNHGEYLFMNGRAIFNFAVVEVPIQVKKLLDGVDLSYSEVDFFLFHQGSRYVVEQLRKRMRLPVNKVPISLGQYGNTVSSSLPLLLENYLDFDNSNNIVMSGFGVGLSWGSCLLSRDK